VKEQEFNKPDSSVPSEASEMVSAKEPIKLSCLFFTFLKLGSYSFGGFMSLVAAVRRELVEKSNALTEEKLVEGISLASLLPGPVAVNVVAFTGNHLRGIRGAAVCMAGVILPSFLLILALSVVYFKFNRLPVAGQLFSGVLPAVAAIILSAAVDMSKKSIRNWKQIIIALIALGVSLASKSYMTAVSVLAGSAAAGCLMSLKDLRHTVKIREKKKASLLFPVLLAVFASAALFCGLLFLPLIADLPPCLTIQRQISLTFSGMGLSAFGGGYIVIPAMQKLFVESLHWLSDKEFSDAIAMGQITPGPIFISAAFIGCKAGGVWGAVNAAFSVFVPPAILTLVCSEFLGFIRDSPLVKAAFLGLRPAVIGVILSAAVFLLAQVGPEWRGWFIFAAAFIIPMFYKIEHVFIIIGAAILCLLI